MYIQNNQISSIGRRTLRPSAKPHAFVFCAGERKANTAIAAVLGAVFA